jgi:hypothetical protein
MNLTAIRSATLMSCVLAAAAHAAEMTIHLDARDVARKRIHTTMELAVKRARSRWPSRNGCRASTVRPGRSTR